MASHRHGLDEAYFRSALQSATVRNETYKDEPLDGVRQNDQQWQQRGRPQEQEQQQQHQQRTKRDMRRSQRQDRERIGFLSAHDSWEYVDFRQQQRRLKRYQCVAILVSAVVLLCSVVGLVIVVKSDNKHSNSDPIQNGNGGTSEDRTDMTDSSSSQSDGISTAAIEEYVCPHRDIPSRAATTATSTAIASDWSTSKIHGFAPSDKFGVLPSVWLVVIWGFAVDAV